MALPVADSTSLCLITQSTSRSSFSGSFSMVRQCSHIVSACSSRGERSWCSANRRARVRYSLWMSSADTSRPLASRTRRRQVMSWLISRMARMGFSSVMSRSTTWGSSSMRSMSDAAPTFTKVVYSLMLESPTITWSRR